MKSPSMIALVPVLAVQACSGDVLSSRNPPANKEYDAFAHFESVVGCWEGQNKHGSREALLIAPRNSTGDSYEISYVSSVHSTLPTCAGARPFYSIERRRGKAVAVFLLPNQYYVWTVRFQLPDDLLFEPTSAPAWMRLRRLAPDRIEWSTAGYTSKDERYIEATELVRMPAPRPQS